MYSQALILVSFATAAVQDVRQRSVNDLVWLPSVAGIALVFYAFVTQRFLPGLELELLKVGLLGGIALAFALFGFIGQADAIAMAIIAADPYPLSPIPAVLAAAVVALGHIGYVFATGDTKKGLTVPMDRFLREQKWIPKAILSGGIRKEVSGDVNVARDEVEAAKDPGASVEVSYGVPTVAYLGVGYAAFLVYLLVFAPDVFFGLP
ncbi:MAG: hypothetical protein HY247_01050 [archaeon]|nr:MAG: hypothetical protein HY247_01050 [archaeon]